MREKSLDDRPPSRYLWHNDSFFPPHDSTIINPRLIVPGNGTEGTKQKGRAKFNLTEWNFIRDLKIVGRLLVECGTGFLSCYAKNFPNFLEIRRDYLAKVTVDRINFKPEAEKERNDEIKRILGEFDFLLIYGLFESFLPGSDSFRRAEN